ncbi:MAG: prolipoprotein diacylglyceryl transferase [Rhodospirillales bacterium]|jgi:phosphatidylglycerol:prolipoprotein diacylglycerol transferase|nr:prolipoprotein diacylglyceryl transferase [Rhodospirillales bacterium]MDP6804903.1 prolipoprotein diacylglyceryl transferase [Rhodospirillales bacterium]
MPFPDIDPIAIAIGPFAVRWYALAYIAGLLIGWWHARRLARAVPDAVQVHDLDDFLVWATIGVVIGGRLGYVLFYRPDFYLEHPLAILQVWRGGMSFHGGGLGVALALAFYARARGLRALAFLDLISCAVPIGLFFGRIANFVNAELIGRVTDVPWAVIFPTGGPEPRHPSQLYEAALEGAVLFVVLNLLWRRPRVRMHSGEVTGAFLVGYAIARAIAELFRAPDAHLGFFVFGTTMGQWLSLPMLLAGLFLILRPARD